MRPVIKKYKNQSGYCFKYKDKPFRFQTKGGTITADIFLKRLFVEFL